jgi:hypothetical protein
MIWIFRDRSNDKLTFKEQWEVVKKGFAKGVKYDGCTASPDLDFGADCCGAHDADYQLGDVSRAEADRALRDCISKKGYVVLPWVYWAGVRLFAGGVWKRYRNKNEETTGSSTDGLA